MQGPLTKTIKKRLALWVAVLLALVALPLPAPARADTAMVRVLLSTQGASELAVTVSARTAWRRRAIRLRAAN